MVYEYRLIIRSSTKIIIVQNKQLASTVYLTGNKRKAYKASISSFCFFWVLLFDLSHCSTHASLMTTAKMGGGKEKKNQEITKRPPFIE